jgi:predicted RNA methylase
MSAWLLQTAPGLAQAIKRELVFAGAIDRKHKLFIKRQRNHDLILVTGPKKVEAMERLRMAETVMRCPLFGRFKISKTQLQLMADELIEIGPRRLVVQVAGRQFDRRDLSRWLGKEMTARGYSFSSDDGSDGDNSDDNGDDIDEVWMICIDEFYYFGIPIMKASGGEGRAQRESERHGSLPPSIAAALAFAGQPANDDVILDPVCGSGTCLSEVHAYAPQARLIGVDIDPEAIKVARANLKNLTTSSQLSLTLGDSRKVPAARQDVTLLIANLPFGIQFGDRASNPELYRDILKNSLAVANPEKWRAVILTSDMESLNRALAEFKGLDRKELFRVKIRGELATALSLKRTRSTALRVLRH